MAQRNIVLIGGSGFVGSYVTRAFAQHNNINIILASRHPEKKSTFQKLRELGKQITPIKMDINDEKSVMKACEQADAIVNLVGILSETKTNKFDHVQVQGAQYVAKVAKEMGAALVHLSAIGADPQSHVPYARTKGLGEIIVRNTCPEATILRPSLIFGKEDQFFNRFVKLSRLLPVMPVFGGGQTRFQPVYVWDIANAIKTCIERQWNIGHGIDVRGKLFELGGPKVYTFREVIELCMKASGRKRPVISLPWSIAYLQGFVLEYLPETIFTITRDQVRMLQRDNVVRSDALQFSDLGIEPQSAEEILPTYLGRKV